MSEKALKNKGFVQKSKDLADLIKFIEDFIYAIITSGLAMNIAKSSRPCSGAEHLLAHAISELKLTDLSHAYVVGSLTDFCLYLHGKHYKNPQFSDAVINLLLDTSRFIQIIDLAKKIRGNRYTILNKFSNQELIDKLHKYIKNSNK